MSKFTTRVELYGNPDYEVYNKLHAAMSVAGFSRQIKLGEIVYWLPNAEYTLDTTSTADTIKNSAVTVASKIWTDFVC
jgi:hypothetical protein